MIIRSINLFAWVRKLCSSGLVGALLLTVGCATLPDEFERPDTFTLPNTQQTTIADMIRPGLQRNTGESGFIMLSRGLEALEIRLAMAAMAEVSIDIQTFIWQADTAGVLLAESLVTAAQRGVRVRILVDDINSGDRDELIATLDSHPNISFRIFNPFGTRTYLASINIRRSFELITNMSRLNHRMHNKIFVVDNLVGIAGGRNVGDEYFGLSEKYNFIDLDILTLGPIVNGISSSFDEYWNSAWAYPITAFRSAPSAERILVIFRDLQSDAEALAGAIGFVDKPLSEERVFLQSMLDRAVYAEAEIIFDSPDKVRGANVDNPMEVVFGLIEQAENTQSELLIISPYFILGDDGREILVALERRGVAVRVMTNSMAAADHMTSFSGFSRHRASVLSDGIQINELKPDLGKFVQEEKIPRSTANGGVHAKAYVFDRERVFIGSFNLDPRSININTEIGLLIHSEALARELGEFYDQLAHPDFSWQPILDERGKTIWIDTSGTQELQYSSDPEAGIWRKTLVRLFKLLPIERQL